jgi:hypothetical protein
MQTPISQLCFLLAFSLNMGLGPSRQCNAFALPPDYQEVETLEIGVEKGEPQFNDNRRYGISLNSRLPDAKDSSLPVYVTLTDRVGYADSHRIYVGSVIRSRKLLDPKQLDVMLKPGVSQERLFQLLEGLPEER